MSCLPPNTEISAAYLSRFRRRCQLFLASEKDITSADNAVANWLISTTDLTQDEIDVLDIPNVRANFRSMYAKVMANGSESWKALAYLHELKKHLRVLISVFASTMSIYLSALYGLLCKWESSYYNLATWCFSILKKGNTLMLALHWSCYQNRWK